jgi:hypothetical protein
MLARCYSKDWFAYEWINESCSVLTSLVTRFFPFGGDSSANCRSGPIISSPSSSYVATAVLTPGWIADRGARVVDGTVMAEALALAKLGVRFDSKAD